eukprot:1786998-Prymnesium_polylepis.1
MPGPRHVRGREVAVLLVVLAGDGAAVDRAPSDGRRHVGHAGRGQLLGVEHPQIARAQRIRGGVVRYCAVDGRDVSSPRRARLQRRSRSKVRPAFRAGPSCPIIRRKPRDVGQLCGRAL